MVNKANLEVSAERVTDKELQQRFNDINKEIQQIWWVNEKDDEIKIVQWSLNWQFAEFLLRPEYRQPLLSLIDVVKKLKSDWSNLWSKAWKGLDDLATFLDDIDDENEMKDDFDEFMDRLNKKPKSLSKMKSCEIRRLNLYLWMNKDAAKQTYIKMKDDILSKWIIKVDENEKKDQDIMFFTSVWNTLNANYSHHPDFIENDYKIKIDDLSETADSLKGILGDNWDGKSESINLPDVENSIVDREALLAEIREKNNKRIRNNEEKIGAITIEITEDDLTDFTQKEWKLKYKWEEISDDQIWDLFKGRVEEIAGDWTSFVNDDEKNNMIITHKDTILGRIKTGILAGATEEQPEEQEPAQESVVDNNKYYEIGNDDINNIIKIKDQALKERIVKDPKFCESLDSETIKFDINEVKKYLETLKEKKRSELKSNKLDKETWIIAVQIALMSLKEKDDNKEFDVKYIDWILWPETMKWVTGFQKKYDLKFKNGRLDENGQPDGLPGKFTISKIVDVLWEWTSGNWWDNWGWKEGNGGGELEEDDGNGGTVTENPKIKDKINSFNVSDPVLDLSELTSLSEKEADQIVNWIKTKLDGNTLQKPFLLNLNWLETLEEKVAQKLSEMDWWISLDGILNEIDFSNCDDVINKLKVLAPDDKKVTILAPSQDIRDKLKDKWVNKVDVKQQ